MSDGVRDGFIENGIYGIDTGGTISLLSNRNKRTKKKRKKNRRKMPIFHRRRKKKHNVRSKRRHTRSNSRIKYTKKGQPYKIMPNGRARFIKK